MALQDRRLALEATIASKAKLRSSLRTSSQETEEKESLKEERDDLKQQFVNSNEMSNENIRCREEEEGELMEQ